MASVLSWCRLPMGTAATARSTRIVAATQPSSAVLFAVRRQRHISIGATRQSSSDAPIIAIVGTGPSGFYTAKYLVKEHPGVRVDLIDALPTPYGLVRSGVAPDHPEVKSVQHDFEQVAADPRVRFLGNVRIGKDLTLPELSSRYNAVVLAYGAASDRSLGIPGEELRNVCSARAFVNWYNGHPDFKSFQPNLDAEDVVIVGQGNVAIDCARILAKTVAELRTTDIAEHALAALSASRVKRVHVIGRRGHVQASFTMKELRELTKLEDAACIVHPDELSRGRSAASLKEIEEHRAKKRMDELLTKTAAGAAAGKTRELALRFLLSPSKLLPSASDPGAVGSIECEVTELSGEPNHQVARSTGRKEVIPAGLVLKSIGYKSVPVDPSLPFDDRKAVVRNASGRVVTAEGAQVPGLYVSGWLKRGPSGIIGTNIPDARETVACILEDAAGGKLPPTGPGAAPGIDGLVALLLSRGRRAEDLVSWASYQAIDSAEVSKGSQQGKPREKFTDVGEMLRAAAAKKE